MLPRASQGGNATRGPALDSVPDRRNCAGVHRRPFLELLGAHTAADEHEQDALERLLGFVEAEPRCFDRTLTTGHVTASAWIVSRDRSRILLTHHRKLDFWLQLGGHCDGDPDVRAAALREAHEESGLAELKVLDESLFDVDVHRIPARREEPSHFHYDARFLIEADPAEPLIVSPESKALAWVKLDDLAAVSTDLSVTRMAAKSRARFLS